MDMTTSLERAQHEPAAARSARVVALDTLRGIVMVIMTIGHARAFWVPLSFAPDDVVHTTPAFFFTRWLGHFCAPAFVFLAGTGAYLHGRHRSRVALSRFLATRGLWLLLLEFTAVHLGWWFTYTPGWPGAPPVVLVAQVIWAIGCSMLALAALVWLPMPLIGAVGLLLVAGHNAFDGVTAAQLGLPDLLWHVLHVNGLVRLAPQVGVIIAYPVAPWVGVLALGYVFGVTVRWPPQRRRRVWLLIGGVAIVLFVALRTTGSYGDPRTASAIVTAYEQGDAGVGTAREASLLVVLMAHLACAKYPPSLHFLLMTLGPTLVLLAGLDVLNRPAPLVTTIGRVPLAYYLVHVPLLNFSAAVYFWLCYGVARWHAGIELSPPEGYVAQAWMAYVIAAAVLLLLWPVCRWYAALKARRRSPWLSYL